MVMHEAMVEIFIMGQRYEVPESSTILGAFEWAGFQLTRGVGCRGGFCGACSTVVRLPDENQLHFVLACQSVVRSGMNLGTLPFFPVQRLEYHLEDLEPSGAALLSVFPEALRCYGCNTCTKACPQGIDVLGYMAAVLRGDLKEVAEKSFDCIQCGLCAIRCPAEIVPFQVALLAHRLFSKYKRPKATHLYERIEAIERGEFQSDIAQLKALSLKELRLRYETRDIEV